MARAALVHAGPIELRGSVERTLAWVRERLSRRQFRVDLVDASDASAIESAIAEADLICVGELRPAARELVTAARLAQARGAVALLPHGYSFCAVSTRVCSTCPLRFVCRDSDRVEIYRRLWARADLIVYQAELHRELHESFVGAYPDKTEVLLPPAPPDLAGDPTQECVAWAEPFDPEQAKHVAEYCFAHPEISVHGFGDFSAVDELPANLICHPRPKQIDRVETLARYRHLLLLPGRPLPIGHDALAMRLVGRGCEINDAVGLSGYLDGDPGSLGERLDESRRALVTALTKLTVGRHRATPTPRRIADRALLWAHHLGLGDSVNLLPLAHTLAAGCDSLLVVMPRAHLDLLQPSLPGAAEADEDFDIERRRSGHDLIVETTINQEGAYGGDILDERWVQLQFAMQPNAYATVHENLLSLFARAGWSSPVSRPRLQPNPSAIEAARARLGEREVDSDRELVVAIHPGSGGAHKRWPTTRFGQLAARLREELSARVVLVGGPGEEDLLEEVRGAVAVEAQSVADPLGDVAALFRCCDLFIGNDSGLMHVACAAGTPAVAIFGPSPEHRWHPCQPQSTVVAARDPSGARVLDLNRVSVSDAWAGARRVLRRVVGEPPRNETKRFAVAATEQHPAAWVGRVARVHVPEADSAAAVEAVLADCAGEATWGELLDRHDAGLLELLVASGVVVPLWSASSSVWRAFGPRSANG